MHQPKNRNIAPILFSCFKPLSLTPQEVHCFWGFCNLQVFTTVLLLGLKSNLMSPDMYRLRPGDKLSRKYVGFFFLSVKCNSSLWDRSPTVSCGLCNTTATSPSSVTLGRPRVPQLNEAGFSQSESGPGCAIVQTGRD